MQTVTHLVLIASLALPNLTLAAEPLAIHPDNPHYFVFQGKPTVLVTSGEHYGAVLNASFDYVKYLDALAKDKLNLTRIFCGQYREVPGSFSIIRNTLAPEEPQFLTPYKRVAPQRYDLRTWNDAYWSRLKDFVSQASKRGIVVEVTLFTTYYNDTHWGLSPLNAANNLQGIGKVGSKEPLTMKDPALVAVEDEFVRKIVTELKDAGNVYYEICNEPYFWGPTEEWQRHMASVITETERKLGVRHLISRNIANGKAEIKDPDSSISIFNFHYARPPETVKMNWALSKPIGLNETGFDGPFDAPYRIQAWDFLFAGGALYNNLDYSFTVGHEDGSFGTLATQPGGGSPKLRSQLRTLIEFFQGFDFIRMKPDEKLIAGSLPADASARAISEPGRAYALYLHHGRPLPGHQPQYVVETKRHRTAFAVTLPEGSYKIRWIDPQSGKVLQEDPVTSNGTATLSTPEYSQDIAADLRRN